MLAALTPTASSAAAYCWKSPPTATVEVGDNDSRPRLTRSNGAMPAPARRSIVPAAALRCRPARSALPSPNDAVGPSSDEGGGVDGDRRQLQGGRALPGPADQGALPGVPERVPDRQRALGDLDQPVVVDRHVDLRVARPRLGQGAGHGDQAVAEHGHVVEDRHGAADVEARGRGDAEAAAHGRSSRVRRGSPRRSGSDLSPRSRGGRRPGRRRTRRRRWHPRSR